MTKTKAPIIKIQNTSKNPLSQALSRDKIGRSRKVDNLDKWDLVQSEKIQKKTCAICDLKNVYDRKKKKWKYRMINHHILYDPPLVITLCYKCHLWWHGSGRVWKHPFVTDEGKDWGSLKFFYAAIHLYEEKAKFA